VEKAIVNLRRAHLLDPARMHRVQETRLAELIRPSGYFRSKAKKLKAFTRFLYARYDGDLARLFATDLTHLRAELLTVYGIGPETADSIILYAGGQPSFVIDAYTRRVFARLGLARADASYDALKDLCEVHLPRDATLYNEYHALLVRLGNTLCRKRDPKCRECPLLELCPFGRAVSGK
jgi:endonuclease-3 related protein